jgi:hypothetical protein
VGQSQRDQLEQPLQGGVQIKVGDQYSNLGPFLLVGAPQILIHTYPGKLLSPWLLYVLTVSYTIIYTYIYVIIFTIGTLINRIFLNN